MNFKTLIKDMKASGKGLMSQTQYMNVGYVLDLLSPCNFLVFGLGEDSYIWEQINAGGKTVFLEDDLEWIEKFKDPDVNIKIHPVKYDTKAQEHADIGFDIEKLKMKLPDEVTSIEWDMILVDGPLGHNPPRPYKGPGRMQSIYTAHYLLKNNGICVVDDMGRLIEEKYASHFFGKENLYNIVENKVGIFKKRK
jgi:glucuronoxylan 4-O-methyltransferase